MDDIQGYELVLLPLFAEQYKEILDYVNCWFGEEVAKQSAKKIRADVTALKNKFYCESGTRGWMEGFPKENFYTKNIYKNKIYYRVFKEEKLVVVFGIRDSRQDVIEFVNGVMNYNSRYFGDGNGIKNIQMKEYDIWDESLEDNNQDNDDGKSVINYKKLKLR